MAYTSLPTVVPGDPVRASWGNQVDTDLDDLDSRVTTLETAVAGADLNGLDDVAVGSPLATGDVLTYNGSTWVNDPPAVVPLATGVSGNLPVANLPVSFAQLYRVTATLSNSQILALPTTPVTVIATPGIGFFRMLVRASLIVDATAGAYTNVNTTFAALFIESQFGPRISMEVTNDGALTTPLTRLTGLLATANKRAVSLGPYVEAIEYFNASGDWGYLQAAQPFNLSDIADAAWRVSIDNNGSGNLTGGHASNTMRIALFFSIEPV